MHALYRIDEELLGLQEGVAHVLKLGDVVGADLLAVLHDRADPGEELSELVDASADLAGGALLKGFHCSGDVGGEGVDILDAGPEAVHVLDLESADEDAVDQLGQTERKDTKMATHKWWLLALIYTR